MLLVDDEEDSRDVLGTLLAVCGARVRSASSVDEALELLTLQPFDVIISDIEMPRRDGYELIRAIRTRRVRTGLARIPAIALTGRSGPTDRRKALEWGYDQHLAKPVYPARLVEEIAHLTTPHTAESNGGEGTA